MAANIFARFQQTGFPDLQTTFNFPSDGDVSANDMIAAYQSDANVFINGTATRAQVANYIFKQVLIEAIKSKIAQHRTIPAVAGAKPDIT